MDLAKKLAKIFSVIFLVGFIASCDSGCVNSTEFDKDVIAVDSNPVKDGVEGFGDAQVAQWHNTGLKTNGGAVTLEITGAWVPWYGNDDLGSDLQLKNLSACQFCSMNGDSPNCICHDNESPTAEEGYTGGDCSTNYTAQNDPTKCTCTTQYGNASDYGVYHFPLNKYDKSHNDLKADFQSPCKYNAGMGLYLGLFGNGGSVTPIRVYHLFSQTEVCDVVRNSAGECLDDAGNDVTKYIFSSANGNTFVKDDGEGNDGIDSDLTNDTYHARNEVVKLIILDSRYDDNYGTYQVSFTSGTGSEQDKGLLEFLVSLIEDKIMGVPDDNGVRQGGIIQKMFNQIVLDSGFIAIVQIALSFYILFYGVSVLIGLADVSKKEIMNRVMKISLVMFFTSATSWYWYNQLVVTFFKDSMDSVISMFMSFSDMNIDPSSGIVTAQMDRASGNSNATRFSYADLIIRNLLSVPSAKKVFGLFFGVPFFGPVYILMIYGLIVFFIYVMLEAAMFYAVAIVKLAFVLSLGPIFIAFTLSSHTNGMFKKWLAYVGARSMEIILMFLVLYNFLVLIDQHFTALLGYKACVSQFNLGLFSIPILKSIVSRSLIQWFSSFMILGGLIFITKLVLQRVPDLAGALISIGGNKAGETGANSSMGIAGGMVSSLKNMAKAVGSAGFGGIATAAAKSYEGVSRSMSGTGAYIGDAISGAIRSTQAGNAAMDSAAKAFNALPSNPRAMYRNSIIDGAIQKAQAKAASEGLTGAKADAAIRASVVSHLMSLNTSKDKSSSYETTIGNSPNKAIAAGLNFDTIAKRLDEKLVHRPLVDFIKSESAKMKTESNPLIGKAMRDELEKRANSWADKNLSGGAASIQAIMSDRNAVVDGIRSGGMGYNNMEQFIRKNSEYTASEAAKAFKDNPEKQKEYLQHLKDNQFEIENRRQQVSEKAVSKSFNKFSNALYDKFSNVVKQIKPSDDAFGRDAMTDTKRASESFIRKVSNEERATAGSLSEIVRAKTGSWLAHNQGSALNPFNLLKDKSAIKQQLREGDRDGVMKFFRDNNYGKEQREIRASYDKKINEAPNYQAKQALRKKMNEKLKESDKRREFFKEQLKKDAVKLAIDKHENIAFNIKERDKLNRKIDDKTKEQNFNKEEIKKSENDLKKAETLAKAKADKIANDKKLLADLKKKDQENPDQKNKDKILKDEEALKKLETEHRADLQNIENIKESTEKLREENSKKNEILQKEKDRLAEDLAMAKIKSMSLEDLVKEIKDKERTVPTSMEIAAAKARGIDPQEQRAEENRDAEMMKRFLREHLEKEHAAVLDKHLEIQKKFLRLRDDEKQELDKMTPKQRQEKMSEYMEKAFPSPEKATSEEERKQVEVILKAAINSLTNDQRKEIEQLGGLQVLKEGVVDINNDTLLEKTVRLDYFNQEFKFVEEGRVGSRSDEESNSAEDAGSSNFLDDITLGLDDEAPHPDFVLADSPAIIAEAQQQDLEAKVADAKTNIESKIKNGEKITEEDSKELEDLKKHEAFDDKDKDKNKPKSGSEERKDASLREILALQVSAINARISDAVRKADLAKDKLKELKISLAAAGGHDILIQGKIAETEGDLKSYEGEVAALRSERDSLTVEISSL